MLSVYNQMVRIECPLTLYIPVISTYKVRRLLFTSAKGNWHSSCERFPWRPISCIQCINCVFTVTRWLVGPNSFGMLFVSSCLIFLHSTFHTISLKKIPSIYDSSISLQASDDSADEPPNILICQREFTFSAPNTSSSTGDCNKYFCIFHCCCSKYWSCLLIFA